jgi:hypothetical protein
MIVDVYMNLHKTRAAGAPVYSVRDTTTGRVIAHEHAIRLKAPVFRVSQAGRARVLATRQKNVHATVRGERVDYAPLGEGARSGTYNPYQGDSFFDRATGEPLHSARIAVLDEAGLRYLPS